MKKSEKYTAINESISEDDYDLTESIVSMLYIGDTGKRKYLEEKDIFSDIMNRHDNLGQQRMLLRPANQILEPPLINTPL
ncbi:MAG: hypothetical protein IT223_08660 [Crocinitomicaceae bacterium]|nr:hypothetical protein [Crocinitomicaceae bacterium]